MTTTSHGADGPTGIELVGPDGLQGTIVALDPGGKTGWVKAMPGDLLSGSNEILSHGGVLGPHEHHDELFDMLGTIGPDIVVGESFDFRQHKGGQGMKDKVELISREYIGVTKLWCKRSNVPYVEQMPFLRSRITNDKLRALGLLRERKLVEYKDYHDACRHLIYYLVFTLGIKKGIADKWL